MPGYFNSSLQRNRNVVARQVAGKTACVTPPPCNSSRNEKVHKKKTSNLQSNVDQSTASQLAEKNIYNQGSPEAPATGENRRLVVAEAPATHRKIFF